MTTPHIYDEATFSLPENSAEKMRICEMLGEDSEIDETILNHATTFYVSRAENYYTRRRFQGKKKQ